MFAQTDAVMILESWLHAGRPHSPSISSQGWVLVMM